MTVRKNFVFDETVAEHLTELAEENGTSMTAMVQELIEERYKSSRVKKRLEAFDRIAGSANGLFVGKTIQSIKADTDV